MVSVGDRSHQGGGPISPRPSGSGSHGLRRCRAAVQGRQGAGRERRHGRTSVATRQLPASGASDARISPAGEFPFPRACPAHRPHPDTCDHRQLPLAETSTSGKRTGTPALFPQLETQQPRPQLVQQMGTPPARACDRGTAPADRSSTCPHRPAPCPSARCCEDRAGRAPPCCQPPQAVSPHGLQQGLLHPDAQNLFQPGLRCCVLPRPQQQTRHGALEGKGPAGGRRSKGAGPEAKSPGQDRQREAGVEGPQGAAQPEKQGLRRPGRAPSAARRDSASEGRGSSGSRREAFTGPQPLFSHTTGHSSTAQNAFCGPSANGPRRAVGVGEHRNHSTHPSTPLPLPDKEPEVRPGLPTLGCTAQNARAEIMRETLSSTSPQPCPHPHPHPHPRA